MGKFMRLCVTEPNVAKLPFMIDSSKFPVVEEGLKCVQGKSIVNSISLEVGEEELLRQAKLCMRYGAGVVIMAFDEQGQAATFEERVRICLRNYRVLRQKIDFPPEDIIFVCNVLTTATGLPEHNSYAIDFINAVAEIKRTCPCVSFSGGLSNLSLSFRGLNSFRDAKHSVSFYQAVPKGLNMSIVNPGGLPRYSDIDAHTRKMADEVILNESADGKHVERFLEYAEQVKTSAAAPGDKILECAIEEKADVIGLSGLITPSLDEMVNVAEQMKARGMKAPLMIGGATTSKRHKAVKLATKYGFGAIHVLEASRSCTEAPARHQLPSHLQKRRLKEQQARPA